MRGTFNPLNPEHCKLGLASIVADGYPVNPANPVNPVNPDNPVKKADRKSTMQCS
jgi:hypothetical protein